MLKRCIVHMLAFYLLSLYFAIINGRTVKPKVLLISANYILLDALNSPDANFASFQKLIREGCLLTDISISDYTSLSNLHSSLLSGGLSETKRANTSECDDLIFNKLSPQFEPLWLTNQRHGFKSASFFWPDDFIAVNKSHPFFYAGSGYSAGSSYFEIQRIHQWLLDPKVTFISIFIPPRKTASTDFLFTYTEYAEKCISEILSSIYNSSALSNSVSIVMVGGLGSVIPGESFEKIDILPALKYWSVSSFSGYFHHDQVIEFWPTPDEIDENLLRALRSNEDAFQSCSTADFRDRHPLVDTGLLPPYFLVSPEGRYFQVGPVLSSSSSLSPFVLLWGSAFRRGGNCSKELDGPLEMTDVYPLVCRALGLNKPWRNQGNLSRVAPLLHQPPTNEEIEDFSRNSKEWAADKKTSSTTLVYGGIIASLALVLAVVFVIFGVKARCRQFNRTGFGDFGVHFRKRRLARGSFAPNSVRRNLTVNNSGLEDADEYDDEAILMEHDPLNVQTSPRRQKSQNRRRPTREEADAFIQMLHSPPKPLQVA